MTIYYRFNVNTLKEFEKFTLKVFQVAIHFHPCHP